MDPVRAAVRELLRTHGPLRLDDLARRLREDGHDIGALEDLEQHLFPIDRVEWVPGTLADGRIVDVEHLLDGIVVTTRLTDEDVAAGRPLWFSPDLDPLLEWLLEDPRWPPEDT